MSSAGETVGLPGPQTPWGGPSGGAPGTSLVRLSITRPTTYDLCRFHLRVFSQRTRKCVSTPRLACKGPQDLYASRPNTELPMFYTRTRVRTDQMDTHTVGHCLSIRRDKPYVARYIRATTRINFKNMTLWSRSQRKSYEAKSPDQFTRLKTRLTFVTPSLGVKSIEKDTERLSGAMGRTP